MLDRLVKLLFPPKCIFCGRLVEIYKEIEVCDGCYNKIPFLQGAAVRKDISSFYDDIICICEYSGVVKDALKRYKFNGKSSYFRAFSSLLFSELKSMTNCRNIDIIVSVPLYKAKESLRGYNQARLISKALSKQSGIREESEALIRKRDTGAQSRIPSKAGRHINIIDAFEVVRPERIRGKSVVLIDDILTTGSTINECSKVLKAAGAKCVVAAVIASGRKY